jgi:Cu/Ag efflux protein CusF
LGTLTLAVFGARADIVIPHPPKPPKVTVEVQGANGYARGLVVSVDSAKSTVTLKHGPIDNLKMPPMTMAYSVSDPSLLGRLKSGDAILFKAEERKGRYFVVEAKSDPTPKAP